MEPEVVLRRIFVRIDEKVFEELRETYPMMRMEEMIRFSIAYTLQKKPPARLKVMIGEK